MGPAHRRRRQRGAAGCRALDTTASLHLLLQVFVKRNSVYVATIIVGAFVGERVRAGGMAAGGTCCWCSTSGGRGPAPPLCVQQTKRCLAGKCMRC